MSKKTQEAIFAYHCLQRYGKTSGVWFESTAMRDYMKSQIVEHDSVEQGEWAWRCTASMSPHKFAHARFNSVMSGLVKKNLIGQKLNRRNRLLYSILYDTTLQKSYWDAYDDVIDHAPTQGQSPNKKRKHHDADKVEHQKKTKSGDLQVVLYQPRALYNSYFPYEDTASPVFEFDAPSGRKLQHGKINIHRGKPKWWGHHSVVFLPSICTWRCLLALNVGNVEHIRDTYRGAVRYAELRSHEDTKPRYAASTHCSWDSVVLAKEYMRYVLNFLASEDFNTRECGVKLLRSYMFCFQFLKTELKAGRLKDDLVVDQRYDLCNFSSELHC